MPAHCWLWSQCWLRFIPTPRGLWVKGQQHGVCGGSRSEPIWVAFSSPSAERGPKKAAERCRAPVRSGFRGQDRHSSSSDQRFVPRAGGALQKRVVAASRTLEMAGGQYLEKVQKLLQTAFLHEEAILIHFGSFWTILDGSPRVFRCVNP